MIEKVATVYIIKNKIEALRSLKAMMQFYNEWMLDLSQEFPLLIQVMHMVLCYYLSLFYYFHCIILFGNRDYWSNYRLIFM